MAVRGCWEPPRSSMAEICSSPWISVPSASKSALPRSSLDLRQVFVHHQRGAAKVADLVGDGAHQDSGVGEQVVQVEVFAAAQIVGEIDDDGGQPVARDRGAVGRLGGEPDAGEKHLAVAAVPLHCRVVRKFFQVRDCTAE